jgi:hypothetical protein
VFSLHEVLRLFSFSVYVVLFACCSSAAHIDLYDFFWNKGNATGKTATGQKHQASIFQKPELRFKADSAQELTASALRI